MKGTGPEFIAAKLAERDLRHRQQGTSRYLVEPNVKDGKGGLRDLHTLFWIAKYFYRVQSREELVKAGVFSRAELLRFRKSEDFLWAVRCHMHFLTGRAEERLSFDLQREMAARLGYTTHPGLKDVERFMKHYFLVAKEVGDLTRIFCAALEEHHGKPVPALNRFLRLGRKRRTKVPGTTDFVVENDRITVADDKVFARDPVNLIRVFHLADANDLQFHPEAMQLITRSLGADRRHASRRPRGQPAVSRDPVVAEERRAGAPRHERDRRARPLHPRLGKVVAMMQFSMYHHYTVDEHLIRSIGNPRRDRARRSGGRAPAGERDIPRDQGSGRPATSRSSCTISPRAGRRITPSPAPGSPGSSGRASASARRRPRPWRGWSSIIS